MANEGGTNFEQPKPKDEVKGSQKPKSEEKPKSQTSEPKDEVKGSNEKPSAVVEGEARQLPKPPQGSKKPSSEGKKHDSKPKPKEEVKGSKKPSSEEKPKEKKASKKKKKSRDQNSSTPNSRTKSASPEKVVPGLRFDGKKVNLQSNTAERFKPNDQRRTSLISEFLTEVHQKCLKNGFEYSGRQYMRCKANFFELVRLPPLFDKHLKSCMTHACHLEKQRIKAKLILLRTLRPSVDFLVGIVTGVPGSGKSSLVRELLRCKYSVVCALANPALVGDYSGIQGVYKMDDLMLSAIPMTADILIIDEYTLAESAEILLLQRKLRVSLLLLVGDVAQGTATHASSIEYLALPVVYRSDVSHRLGPETTKLCGKQGNRMVSKGKKDRVIFADYEGETDATEKNLAFSKATVDDLKEMGYDCSLVKDVQGKEYDSVTLFIRNEDRKAVGNKHLRLVALTRHKSLLIVRAETEIRQAFMTGDIDLTSKTSNAHKYSEHPPDEDHGWF